MSEVTNVKRLAGRSRVLRVALSREGTVLTLSLILKEIESGEISEFEFANVSDVQFRSSQVDLSQIVLLLFEDISARGWEGCRYLIKDSEGEFVSFYCARIGRS